MKYIFPFLNRFVTVLWKKDDEIYQNNKNLLAKSGLQIRVINSRKGPGSEMKNALWRTADTSKVKRMKKPGHTQLMIVTVVHTVCNMILLHCGNNFSYEMF